MNDSHTASEAPGSGGNSYDAVPYSVHAFPQTQPNRLAAVAALFGLEAPCPRNCRVLELACASGGNLIPLALTSPDSTFVGIDLSSRQIADGQAVTRELKLDNVELKALSILDVNDDFGTFDYILAHGVYSWVPADVQDKILDICRKNLSANGVAYVSYNTFPGWHARGAIREMLCYHTDRLTDPSERISEARKLLHFLVQSAGQGVDGYSMLLRQELAVLAQTPDSYLLHEHLEEYNEPVYFHQFAERAAAKGLQYLAEAHVGAMMAARFGAEAEQTLRRISPDLLHIEQYMDFMRNRMFRQTLLCHETIALDHVLRRDAVKRFYIAAAVKPKPGGAEAGESEQFVGGAGATLVTHDPLLKAAMGMLSKLWPLPVSFDKLLAAARTQLGDRSPAPEAAADSLAARLLHCHASGLVEFSLGEPAFRVDVAEFPVASPYARLRARDGGNVVNLRLETVPMGKPSRQILEHLDGTHDLSSLNRLLADWLATESPASSDREERARHFVSLALHGFARSALLV